MKTDTKENLKEKQIKKQQGLCGMICHVIYLELKHCPVICIISILLTIGTGVCTAANVFFKQNFMIPWKRWHRRELQYRLLWPVGLS